MQEKNFFKRIVIFLSAFVLWGVMTTCWAYVWYEFYGDDILRPFGYKGNWLVIAVYGLILVGFANVYGVFRVGYYKRGDVIFSGFLVTVLTNGITYLQTCLVGRRIMNPVPFLFMTIVDFLVVWVWGDAAGKLYIRLYPPRQMLVIYGEKDSARSLIHKMTSRSERYDICEVVSIEEGLPTIFERIDGYSAVIICDVKSIHRNTILKYCYSRSIRVYLTPKISDTIVGGADKIHLFDTPLLLCRNGGLSFEQRLVKRAIDLMVASVALIVASPFMLLICAAIKLHDGGDIIYRQKRLTQNGKVFEIYKFRSMIMDAEGECGARLAEQDDCRITPVGKFIRKIRFDELPQIFNILKGDMSLVGPRPERPEIAVEYEKIMPEFSFRLKVKAGLTGYAQVMGKYNTTPYDKLKLDLMYIEEFSILQDIKLILMTIKILFNRDSTEGIKR
ncbi:exopolysaccharide biosynthesis polyprenyl glycosylphosphotransferase [Oscillospiraceae bacterium MB08-C2-2]|nr:exopolysaccharide biosynthesis polyprenyl glycosylphosphotransferase [Oscillospiraceae bacterium MB08-C2-2]